MKNVNAYNQFIESLEPKAQGGLFYHRINMDIYITDFENKLLGIWDAESGKQK